jgi:hypothetical protein
MSDLLKAAHQSGDDGCGIWRHWKFRAVETALHAGFQYVNHMMKDRDAGILARDVLAHVTPIAGLFSCSGENPRDPLSPSQQNTSNRAF